MAKDMYQKRKERKENKSKEQKDENRTTKTNINWYPGHMAKTRKQIIEDLKLVDVVVEILDSRIPISSRNPDMAEITKNKRKIVILNKCDLSDDSQNKRWISYFENQGIPAVLVDSNSGYGIQNSIKQIENVMQDELSRLAEKGRIGRKIRAMIMGIPNVGKSSFINRIAGKTSAEVANRPGVTRSKQWIRVNDRVELLDTPGILWPKFESQKVALDLSFTGSIKDDILDRVEVAYSLLKFLLENYRENICSRYNFKNEYIEEVLKQDNLENENIYQIMLEIGKKRGAVIAGGNIDEEKTARMILEDFRSGKLGRITLEKADK